MEEILGLQKSDIDNNILTIRRSINGRGQITEGKNKNAHRSLFLSPTMKLILNKQLARTQHLETVWLFPNEIGSQAVQSTTLKRWKLIANEIGSSSCLYSFRHTFISILKTSSISENLIKSIVGHSASMDTFGVYGHEISGEKEAVATAIEQTIKKII